MTKHFVILIIIALVLGFTEGIICQGLNVPVVLTLTIAGLTGILWSIIWGILDPVRF